MCVYIYIYNMYIHTYVVYVHKIYMHEHSYQDCLSCNSGVSSDCAQDQLIEKQREMEAAEEKFNSELQAGKAPGGLFPTLDR